MAKRPMKIAFQDLNEGDLLNPKHLYALVRHGGVVGLVQGRNKEDALTEIVNHYSKYYDLEINGESCYYASSCGKNPKWVLRDGWSLIRLRF